MSDEMARLLVMALAAVSLLQVIQTWNLRTVARALRAITIAALAERRREGVMARRKRRRVA
ncbi:MAG TPA: hypothetical protein VIU64_06560 [Polyangia bacterium]